MKWWDQTPWSLFFECWILSQLFHSSLSPSSRGPLSSSLLSAIRVISSVYLRLLIFLPAILIPACASSSPAFHMMYFAYKLSRWQYTVLTYSFPNLEPVHCSMSGSNCCFLTCIQVSQEAGKVVWYFHLLKNFPQFIVFHTVKGSSAVNEDDVFLESSCFFFWSNRCWQFDLCFLCLF